MDLRWQTQPWDRSSDSTAVLSPGADKVHRQLICSKQTHAPLLEDCEEFCYKRMSYKILTETISSSISVFIDQKQDKCREIAVVIYLLVSVSYI